MEGLLGPKLMHGNSEVETSSLQGGFVAIYFSAHWCPPCKAYTPELKKVYEKAKKKGRAFDVVFVSSDRDQASFNEYFGSMPWHAVPYSDRMRQQVLSTAFNVRGIPSLVLLDGAGKVIDANARSKAVQADFLASLPRLEDLAAAALPLPEGPVPLLVRYRGQEIEIECEPEEGWEILQMQIFSVTEVPAEHQRLFGLGRHAGLLDEQVPLPRALAQGIAARKNTGLKVAGVPADARKASSTHTDGNLAPSAGQLNSGFAWCAADKIEKEPWYQMDLSGPRQVAGVVISGRANAPQWVNKFRVTTAQSEDGPWTAADGSEFDGPDKSIGQHNRVFQSPVSARFVRIHVLSYEKHASLRADVLLAEGAEADKPPSVVVLSNFSADDPLPVTAEAAAKDKMVEEQHFALLQAKLSSLPQKLQHQAQVLHTVQRYESKSLQRQALDEIPVVALDEAATAGDGNESYEVAFMKSLLRWFKHDFFSWCNAPRCEHCGGTTKTVGTTQPTQEERQSLAGNVEVAQCSACGKQTRFPRYNEPGKLLETRTGRCGEWANCFTLVCRALGYEARYISDWTDHVWTEVYFDSLKRWVHLDSCEAAFDKPMVYEKGWGKKLTYILAFARDHVVDVTRRYTQKLSELQRNQFPEDQLKRAIAALSEFSTDRSLAELPEDLASKRRAVLERRAEEEEKLLSGQAAPITPEEQVGRTSGDAAWRSQRGELGATAASKDKALQLSEKGLDSGPKVSAPGSGGYSGKASPVSDPQAAAKARFAELVASGLPPNEAALKVLQEARK